MMTCLPVLLQGLKSIFFARIASITLWLHQGVLLSLIAAILSRFRPQPSIADEIIAVRNNDHFISKFLETMEIVGTLKP